MRVAIASYAGPILPSRFCDHNGVVLQDIPPSTAPPKLTAPYPGMSIVSQEYTEKGPTGAPRFVLWLFRWLYSFSGTDVSGSENQKEAPLPSSLSTPTMP